MEHELTTRLLNETKMKEFQQVFFDKTRPALLWMRGTGKAYEMRDAGPAMKCTELKNTSSGANIRFDTTMSTEKLDALQSGVLAMMVTLLACPGTTICTRIWSKVRLNYRSMETWTLS